MTVGSTITYATLISSKSTAGSIAAWLSHDAIVAAAPTIVAEAESWIYRQLRHWRMVSRTTGTMTIGNDYINMPVDYLEDKILYVTGTNYQKMTRKTAEEVVASYNYDGNGDRINQQPMIYSNDQASLLFDSPSDQSYPYLLWYYQQLQSLSTTSTNFLTQFYPRLLRCACCAAAAEFMKDAGQGTYDRTYWDQMAQAALNDAQVESDHSQRSIDIGFILQ